MNKKSSWPDKGLHLVRYTLFAYSLARAATSMHEDKGRKDVIDVFKKFCLEANRTHNAHLHLTSIFFDIRVP
jgi:hypothetical protein